MMIRVAIDTVLATSVGALKLRRHHFALCAEDEVVGLVQRPISLRVEPVKGLLAEAVLAFWTITSRYQASFDAIELPWLARVQRVSWIKFRIHGPRNFDFFALITHDLQAPLDFLRVQLTLVVHLRKCSQKGFQRPDH